MTPYALPDAGAEAVPPNQGAPSSVVDPEDEASLAELAAVKKWLKRIRKSKDKFQPDFDRMKENMKFSTGKQWDCQKNIRYDKYVVNMTVRMINQKVATLYARNPQVEVYRRKRLDYLLWDEKMETIQQVITEALMAVQQGGEVPPEHLTLLQDYEQGTQYRRIVDKIAKTLELGYQYQVDTQQPEFKTQAKQFVRRVVTTGVGFIRVNYCNQAHDDYEITTSRTEQGPVMRQRLASELAKKIDDGEIEESDPQVQDFKALLTSLEADQVANEIGQLQERLVFDFPPATSIIVDPRCRALKGFVGAHWIAQEFFLPRSVVNGFFQIDIKGGGGAKVFGSGSSSAEDQERELKDDAYETDKHMDDLLCVYEVFDLDTKSKFFLCEGYKTYVREPEPVFPATKGFWQIFALTFNDCEVEDESEASIYPPSDVDLIYHPQKEWNRTREALRQQRKANSPKYMIPKGTLTDTDKEKLMSAADNEVIELEGVPPGVEPGKIVQPLQVAAIDSAVYDTRPLQEDALLATGMQEANIGPAQPNVTATVGTIAEQSRMTVSSSNVDDLDDCLSAVAACGGELMMRLMSVDTMKRIVGRGSVWPESNLVEDFVNEIELQIKAASSGRPNRAIEIANWERIAPLLIQSGANPQAIIRESIKRVDDLAEPQDFFPIPSLLGAGAQGSGQPQQPGQGQPGQPQGPQQPLQDNPSKQSVPLAAA